MSTDAISPALDYLTDAAHLMRASAPDASAHLMSQRSLLMFEHGMAPSDIQRQLVCGACGHIMVPGNESSTLKLEARRSRRHRHKQGSHQTSRSTVQPKQKDMVKMIHCGRCDKITRVNLAAPPAPASRGKVAREKPGAVASKAEPTTATTPVPPTSNAKDTGTDEPDASSGNKSANASSKKRAKNRKAGLQALLAGQQQQQKRNPLSLSDFMKK